MRIDSAVYVKSFTSFKKWDLDPLPAFCFVGRSNVGKSSLINHLTGRKSLVKTSSTPGKTQLINLFLINEAFYFVDLPGYGFASVPLAVKQSWQKMIFGFLQDYPDLRLVFQILDLRHQPSKEDQEFHQAILEAEIPLALIGNKLDKLGQSARAKQAGAIKKALHFEADLLLHSALAKKGKEEILDLVSWCLEDRNEPDLELIEPTSELG
ncbi:MAG: hypothetical protein A2508_07515 [Candidatus Lambdaproteobacteria bacterium RIFOXYD12_FULL_49_8]|uniref:Probable GTP-binding protein EngB n=1 Tax=Candidatus Lambdaproteobacteria bacterium RIFOXYD2_FULL_50_16 TaxID=1817772 RepID=A0A1F6GAQ0_9PROT|nr:MAG: hypothetical protein A2527_08450 [Candidatus Lambdaproteobacteria bacterium RIFOXYD2_FULL_50_16]OGG98102.1 MAG: hypothetical protein A2508_07515 [Candidatus Lambdaproteobacteria bacterium RIFOXYD12_FULL_49_8]